MWISRNRTTSECSVNEDSDYRGAGFVGSKLAIFLKNHLPASSVIWFDNLKRRGSELNLTRLKRPVYDSSMGM